MSAQAETMQGMVGELVAMVGGAGNGDGKMAKHNKGGKPRALAAAVKKMTGKAIATRKQSKPAVDAFPLDEKEFSEF
jgi:hypothetical protein